MRRGKEMGEMASENSFTNSSPLVVFLVFICQVQFSFVRGRSLPDLTASGQV